jgi:hypothetical protein
MIGLSLGDSSVARMVGAPHDDLFPWHCRGRRGQAAIACADGAPFSEAPRQVGNRQKMTGPMLAGCLTRSRYERVKKGLVYEAEISVARFPGYSNAPVGDTPDG